MPSSENKSEIEICSDGPMSKDDNQQEKVSECLIPFSAMCIVQVKRNRSAQSYPLVGSTHGLGWVEPSSVEYGKSIQYFQGRQSLHQVAHVQFRCLYFYQMA